MELPASLLDPSLSRRTYKVGCGRDKKCGYTDKDPVVISLITAPSICVIGILQIVTLTSNIQGAGTDANVFIDIHGALAATGRNVLKNDSRNPFERGQVSEGQGVGCWMNRPIILSPSAPHRLTSSPCTGVTWAICGRL